MALEIFKTGKKSFIYRYRLNGKQKFLTIDDVLITDLDYARDTANDYARMVRRGDDPKFPANIGDDMTVRALVEDYKDSTYYKSLSADFQNNFASTAKRYIEPPHYRN